MNAPRYIGLILLILSFQARAYPVDTLRIANGFSTAQLNGICTYFFTEREISSDSAWSIFRYHQPLTARLDKINLGPVNGYYWIALTLHNLTENRQELYLEIRQPHLFGLKFYRVSDEAVPLLAETGIKFNFFKRPVQHRYFDFPISVEPGQTFTFLLMAHHINSLSLPLHLVTREAANQDNYKRNLVWGYWLGFLSFCALFALIAFVLLRKIIFLWYFLYITSAALYGFTDLGFGFQFLFPTQEGMDAPAIVHLGIYSFIFLIKFSQELLQTRTHIKLVHQILNGIFYFLVAMIAAGLLMQEVMFRFSTIVLPVVNLMIIAGLILLAYCGIRSLFINRIIAIFYLAAYLTLIASGVFVMLAYAFGVIQYFGINPILISYFLEAMLLSVALVILFRQVQQERTALAIKVSTQQKEMYQQYINGIEKERSRIAGELHDDIGSRLSHLKRGIQHSSENATSQLDEIIQDIRMLSHDLAPPVAKVSGLIPLVEKMIVEARKSSGIDIKLQLFDYQERLPPQEIQQVFRILQEAVHNIVNHSGATHVDIQLFGYDDELVLTIEDDGKGFEPEKAQGLGLTQMKVRTESLGGKIEINSQPSRGCHILIQIPFKAAS